MLSRLGLIFLILAILLNPHCNTIPEKKSFFTFTPSDWKAQPLVLTKYGYVEATPDKDKTWVWKSIPYASPPLKDLRWKAPRNPEAWEGVRKIFSLEKACTQFVPFFNTVKGTEDCLYLNLWRPKTSEKNLPVYVWIHGGGNSIGSSMMSPDYAGHSIASNSNMIFISLNYRLGPFGWFYYNDLHDGISPEDDSGNYGSLDIIKALHWIRENIAAFGGNPENVVVAGESAGSMNALSLLISPAAKGLFSKVICQSGGQISNTPEKAQSFAENLLHDLIMADSLAQTKEEARRYLERMSKNDIQKYLYQKTSTQIITALRPKTLGMAFIPTILTDGYVILKEGYKSLETGNYPNKVPVMLGTNKDEAKLFLYFSGLAWKNRLYETIGKYSSQIWKAKSVDAVSDALSKHEDQPMVYAYEFSWGSVDETGQSSLPGNWGKKLGSFHSLEIPFFLGTVTQYSNFLTAPVYSAQNLKERKILSSAIMKYVKNFVITGNPNPPDKSLPAWNAWTSRVPGFLVLNARTDKNAQPKTSLDVYMKHEILKEKNILREIKEDLSPEIYEKVIKYLEFAPSMSGERLF